MGNFTLNDRMDMLEVIVRGLVTQVEMMGERVDGLKQPVVIEKVKYRNRVKPLAKKKRDIEKGRKRKTSIINQGVENVVGEIHRWS